MAASRDFAPCNDPVPEITADELFSVSDQAAHKNVAEWKRAMLRAVLDACKTSARAGHFSATFRATPCPDARHAARDSCYDELRVFIAARIHGARISGTRNEVTVSWTPPRGPTFTIVPPPQDGGAPATLPIPK